MRKVALPLLTLLLALSALTACSGNNYPQNEDRSLAVVFAVGPVANSASPDYKNSHVQRILTDATWNGSSVGRVILDGDARRVVTVAEYRAVDSGIFGDPTSERNERRDFWPGELATLLTENATARSEETNPLAALNAAATWLDGFGSGYRRHVIIMHSGLQTKMPLDMQALPFGLISSGEHPTDYGIEDIVSILASRRMIPEFPSGTQITWIGLGHTADDQDQPDVMQLEWLENLWQAIVFEGSGATINFVDSVSADDNARGTLPHVTLVPMDGHEGSLGEIFEVEPPAPAPEIDEEEDFMEAIVLNEHLRFIANTADPIHREQAEELLGAIGEILASRPDITVLVYGGTARVANPTLSGSANLSRERAEYAARIMVAAGARPDQIVTRGTAWENDRFDSSDPLNEANRFVAIVNIDSSEAQAVIARHPQ
ncbi:hypothetical protein FWH13_01785 [Candidatus Saccharibacteria bacterium]|nr:hypothetical protein [Candidatus Saccharibacteria bacterium]